MEFVIGVKWSAPVITFPIDQEIKPRRRKTSDQDIDNGKATNNCWSHYSRDFCRDIHIREIQLLNRRLIFTLWNDWPSFRTKIL